MFKEFKGFLGGPSAVVAVTPPAKFPLLQKEEEHAAGHKAIHVSGAAMLRCGACVRAAAGRDAGRLRRRPRGGAGRCEHASNGCRWHAGGLGCSRNNTCSQCWHAGGPGFSRRQPGGFGTPGCRGRRAAVYDWSNSRGTLRCPATFVSLSSSGISCKSLSFAPPKRAALMHRQLRRLRCTGSTWCLQAAATAEAASTGACWGPDRRRRCAGRFRCTTTEARKVQMFGGHLWKSAIA